MNQPFIAMSISMILNYSHSQSNVLTNIVPWIKEMGFFSKKSLTENWKTLQASKVFIYQPLPQVHLSLNGEK